MESGRICRRPPSASQRVAEGRERILTELRKVIVGQDDVIEQVLIALFTGGHCLITGVPGLAKTLLIKTLADILDLDFKRIQFTPDLMPSDITGTEILDEEQGSAPAALREGADLREDHPGRRDQPHAAEDAGGAARGDAGAPRHGGGPDLSARASRSSCSPRRTRSSWRARIRCPRRSSIASCSTSSSTTSREDDEVRGRDADDRARSAPTPARVLSGPDILAVPGARRGRSCIAEEVARYAVRLVDASRPGPPGRARVRRQVGEVGRRSARVAGARARRRRRAR